MERTSKVTRFRVELEPALKMDRWKYYWIVHQYHTIMNPVDEEKLDQLLDMLRLDRNAWVLDVGSGKGEMLIRLYEKYHVSGVGIDKSPYSIREADELKKKRAPESSLEFLEMDGALYKPGHDFDLTMCIGASWIYDGHQKTLKALKAMTKPYGYVMVGEPYWKKAPPKEYLDIEELKHETFSTYQGNVEIGEKEGLRLAYILDANVGSWDKYEGLHWYATDKYVVSHPEDPDIPELLAIDLKEKNAYLRWGRDVLGWAIYLFRKSH